MPRLTKSINTNLTGSVVAAIRAHRNQDNNTMNREIVFPLVVGVILGAFLMIFWQFNSRLNNVAAGVTQLGQVATQNSQTVNDVVSFINNATGQAGQAGQTGTTPTPPAAE